MSNDMQLDSYANQHRDTRNLTDSEDRINQEYKVGSLDNLITFSLPYRFIQLCMILFIGIGIGYLYFIVYTNYASSCSIAYVSNEEIILLEKERISNEEDNENKKLFYGKTEEAFMLIDSITKGYENKNTKIVFVNDKFVRGKDVFSISKQVHRALIDVLSKKENKQVSKRENTNNSKDDLMK